MLPRTKAGTAKDAGGSGGPEQKARCEALVRDRWLCSELLPWRISMLMLFPVYSVPVPSGLLLHRQKVSGEFYSRVKVSLTAFQDKM